MQVIWWIPCCQPTDARFKAMTLTWRAVAEARIVCPFYGVGCIIWPSLCYWVPLIADHAGWDCELQAEEVLLRPDMILYKHCAYQSHVSIAPKSLDSKIWEWKLRILGWYIDRAGILHSVVDRSFAVKRLMCSVESVKVLTLASQWMLGSFRAIKV